MQYIDTNVFLRLLTNDHAEQSPRAHAYFKRLEAGEVRATIGEAVLLEIIFVLSSPKSHALPRLDVAARVRSVLAPPRSSRSTTISTASRTLPGSNRDAALYGTSLLQ